MHRHRVRVVEHSQNTGEIEANSHSVHQNTTAFIHLFFSLLSPIFSLLPSQTTQFLSAQFPFRDNFPLYRWVRVISLILALHIRACVCQLLGCEIVDLGVGGGCESAAEEGVGGGGLSDLMSPSNGLQNGGGGGSGLNYIEHQVSKLDTLAGVAIKYGVEVADIKRMNGLATDLQMFALKTLRIPLPGRHAPSPSLPDESAKLGDNSPERRPPHMVQSSMQEPFQSLRVKEPRQSVSPAMTTLQKYYGLQSSNSGGTSEGTEMAVYTSAGSDYFTDEWLPKASPMSDLPPNHHQKLRNLAYDLLTGNCATPLTEIGDGGGGKSDEKYVRRRQKGEVDSGAGTPEKLLKEENGGGISGFSPSTGKGLAMRPKSASRTTLLAVSDSGCLDPIPMGLGESIMTDGFSAVRKSSSTSSLKEQEKNNAATVWPTGWSLKPDLQALSTATIAKPIFDGLPIPITGRRSKAALD